MNQGLVDSNNIVAWRRIPENKPTWQRISQIQLNVNKRCSTSFTSVHARVRDLVAKGTIALVKGAYFEECLQFSRPYAKRQSIPVRHLWSNSEAIKQWDRHKRRFFVVVSYGWLSIEHP